MEIMLSYLPTILYVVTTSSALILIKLGSTQGAIIELVGGRPVLHPTLINLTGIALYGVSFVVYTFLVAKYDLGYIIPLTMGFVYIAIFLASFFIFNEPFSTLKLIAIALILCGVALLNLPQQTIKNQADAAIHTQK